MSSTASNVFDGFFAGCAAFAGACAFFDWVVGEKRKSQIKDAILRIWYFVQSQNMTELSHKCYAVIIAPFIFVFGTRPLSVRMMIPYGVLAFVAIASISPTLASAAAAREIRTVDLAFCLGILGCVATLWIPLAASLWLLYSVPGRSAGNLALVLSVRLMVVAAAGLLAVAVCCVMVAWPLAIHSFLGLSVNPLLITHPPTHNVRTDLGQAIADGLGTLIVTFITFGIIFLIVGATTLLPIALVLLILLVFALLTLLLHVTKRPVALALERIFESPQGVVTQFGIGIAAIGKVGQFFLKYGGFV